MQTITTIGLDIAKSVFQVHGVNAAGQVVIRRQLKRRYVLAFFEKLSPCLVGIEACASSHHWSRELQALGHTVRLMPPAYVKPHVKRQKNDESQYAVRANEDARAAKLPDAPSHAPSVHSPTDGCDQCEPSSPCGVEGGPATMHGSRAPTGGRAVHRDPSSRHASRSTASFHGNRLRGQR